MKKVLNFVTLASLALSLAVTGCKKTDAVNGNRETNAGPLPSLPIKHISGVIGTRTFDRDTIYKLDGIVYVSGGSKTLTIESGTWITNGNKVAYPKTGGGVDSIAGVLVITRGNKINAVGLPNQPIVFTSDKSTATRKAGDFGGIIIEGAAPVNQATPVIEGLPSSPPVSVAFGGCDPNDDSGTLSYVRIEFPGFALQPDNEVNGLTLAGVGALTDLDHIQVSYSADDAFEFFGGTVNAKFLIALGSNDDDFDFDWGYTGKIQFAIALKDPASTHSASGGSSDSNGIESDNQGTSSSTNRPFTNPQLANFTILGAVNSTDAALFEKGVHFRRSSSFTFKNSIVSGFLTAVHFEGITASFTNGVYNNCASLTQVADTAEYDCNVTHAFTTLFTSAPAPGKFGSTKTSLSGTPDTYLLLGTSTASNPFYPAAPVPYSLARLAPRSTSPAFSGACATPPGAFFTTTTYHGAVAPTGASGSTLWNIPASGTKWVDWTPFNDSNS